MINLPADIIEIYDRKLSQEKVPVSYRNFYKKWLRYFWDFCSKYRFDVSDPKNLPSFIEKLKTKKQSPPFQRQAHHAVNLYHELLNEQPKTAFTSTPSQYRAILSSGIHKALQPPVSVKSSLLEQWSRSLADLSAEIKVRHYSPKTLKTYSIWGRKFQFFTRNKELRALSSSDVKEYMKFLAVTQKVSASSQNQAFNALLFFFRHVSNRILETIRIM
jgi:hypothetical protein